MIKLSDAQFLTSANSFEHWPVDYGAEVAFVGRSNVGKSSAINAITNRKGLARTSKTPGRTQLINFFTLNDQNRLVDLPGYGFAKVPDAMRKHWEKSIEQYLRERQCLRALVVLMDARRPLTPLDQQMMAWCDHRRLPVIVPLTKADKLSRSQASQTLHQVKKALAAHDYAHPILFSAVKNTGVEEIRTRLISLIQQ